MMSQPYVHGITDTVTHGTACSLTAGHIAAGGNTLSAAVVCPDRWFPGDVAVITSRDGRAFAGQVARWTSAPAASGVTSDAGMK